MLVLKFCLVFLERSLCEKACGSLCYVAVGVLVGTTAELDPQQMKQRDFICLLLVILVDNVKASLNVATYNI